MPGAESARRPRGLWPVAALALAYALPACAPSLPRGGSIADSVDAPDAVLAIGRAGDLAYAVTRDGKLRTFNLRTRELRTLNHRGVIAVARDAAVGLRASATMIEAFEPASGTVIATHRFENGIARVLGVSRAVAFIVAKTPPSLWPTYAAVLPPATEVVTWDLRSGKVDVSGVWECDDLGLSADGAISSCDLGWTDRRSRVTARPQALAPEWAPPPDPDPDESPAICGKCAPIEPETGMAVLSTWLAVDGSSVYVTYHRTVGAREWRLDRWIPDATGKTTGQLQRLAVSGEPIADRVVAVSRDGRTVVTNPGLRPPVLRHAPGYEGVPLLAPPVTAAAFSEDERQIVTGHRDGRLRLWQADSGRFAAVSPE